MRTSNRRGLTAPSTFGSEGGHGDHDRGNREAAAPAVNPLVLTCAAPFSYAGVVAVLVASKGLGGVTVFVSYAWGAPGAPLPTATASS